MLLGLDRYCEGYQDALRGSEDVINEVLRRVDAVDDALGILEEACVMQCPRHNCVDCAVYKTMMTLKGNHVKRGTGYEDFDRGELREIARAEMDLYLDGCGKEHWGRHKAITDILVEMEMGVTA